MEILNNVGYMFKRFFQGLTSLFFDKEKFVQSATRLNSLNESTSISKPDNTTIKNGKASYNSQRSRNLYKSTSSKPFKISRSKLDLFLRCQRCFYLDRRLGVSQPQGYPFLLNKAVDELLKKEFDSYRAMQRPHPFCIENNIDAIPFKHDDINRWRNSLHAGVQYLVSNTNIMLYGGLDDVWINTKTKELIVVDYKATSKAGGVSLGDDWQIGYKRQVEIYQWLLRKNNFPVSNIAYFVYCNGKTNMERFDKKLDFDISILPYIGNDSWVEDAVMNAYACLQSDQIPSLNETCEYCQYWTSVNKHLNKIVG